MAFFGEKDWQQLLLVRSMVDAFFMDVEVVPCPIVRGADGVALSSRNALLDQESSMKAAEFDFSISDSFFSQGQMKELRQ